MLKSLFAIKGRIPRSNFWLSLLTISLIFIVLYAGLDNLFGHSSTLLLYPVFFGLIFSLSARRYHDLNRCAFWLLLLLIPIFGVLIVAVELLIRRGTAGENTYGADPLLPKHDYLEVQPR